MRRPAGSGTIETRTNDDGSTSYRARVPTLRKGGKLSGPWVDSEPKAEAWRVKLLDRVKKGVVVEKGEPTLGEFWTALVEELESKRKVKARHYDNAWRQRVEGRPIAAMRLSRIDRRAIRAFVNDLLQERVGPDERQIAVSTAKTAVAALSGVLTAAVKREMIAVNPLHDLDLEWPDEPDAATTLVYWEPDEISRFLSHPEISEVDRVVVQFYMGTGLRAGEGVWMPLADLERAVKTGELFVRFGSKGRAPKGGKTRTIPLLPMARAAAERWLELLPTFCPENPHRLAFPQENGDPRGDTEILGVDWRGGERVTWFDRHQETAGVKRIVWHGLRHTCGAALASGWWGRTWALHEIRDLLGHGSVRVTEKYYGHLAPSALRRAADETAFVVERGVPPGPGDGSGEPPEPSPDGSGRSTDLRMIPGGSGSEVDLGGLAGLRRAVDARLAARDYPTPDECAAIATEVLRRDALAAAALAVIEAPPEFRLKRLLEMLEHVRADAASRKGGAK